MAKKKKKKAAKQPSGLKIERKGKKFVFSWKNHKTDKDSYQKIQVGYKLSGWDSFKKISDIKPTDQKCEVTLSDSYLWPIGSNTKKTKNTYNYIQFKIRAKTKKVHKPKFKKKKFNLDPPNKPSKDSSLIDIELDGSSNVKTKFSWTIKEDAHKWFLRSYAETCLLNSKDNATINSLNAIKAYDGSWVDAKKSYSDTGAEITFDPDPYNDKTSASAYVEEVGMDLGQNTVSYLRCFRIQSRGPGAKKKKGEWLRDSDYAYGYMVYSKPKEPKITGASCTTNKSGNLELKISWSQEVNPDDFYWPIDSTTVEYVITNPTIVDGKLSPPPGTGFTPLPNNYNDQGSASITDFAVNPNQCIFVRVVNSHNRLTTESKAVMVTSNNESLPLPSDINASYNYQSKKLTVTSVTNESELTYSFLAVIIRTKKDDVYEEHVVGLINQDTSFPYTMDVDLGENADGFDYGIKAVVCPSVPLTVRGYADISTIKPKGGYYDLVDADGASIIAMQSNVEWKAVDVPKAPKKVTITNKGDGWVVVEWEKTWKTSDYAEISWSQKDVAWESNEDPNIYRVTVYDAKSWNIINLDIGVTWYFRVRLIKRNGADDEIVGPWSELNNDDGAQTAINLSTVPKDPILWFAKDVIQPEESIYLRWAYVTDDKQPQNAAQIARVTQVDGVNNYDDFFEITNDTAQQYELTPELWGNTSSHGGKFNTAFVKGQTYNLAVRVRSEQSAFSNWSPVVPLKISDKISCSFNLSAEGSSFVQETDAETGNLNNFLVELPLKLKVDVENAGNSYDLSLIVERTDDYDIDRPDENPFADGFADETIVTSTQTNTDNMFEIALGSADLVGRFDDGDSYRAIATISDGYGQKYSTEEMLFTVRWNQQAQLVTAEALPEAVWIYEESFDNTVDAGKQYYTRTKQADTLMPSKQHYVYTLVSNPTGSPAAKGYFERSGDYPRHIVNLKVNAPAENYDGDYFEVYRLSVDRPELIIEHGEFSTPSNPIWYVDPFPTIGEYGGHRIVYRTKYGDYITADGIFSWIDLDEDDNDRIDVPYNIFDFDDDTVNLMYNVDFSNSWSKDFQETKYLGGSVRGDWGMTYSRTGSVDGTVEGDNEDTIQAMRRLAVYTGECHIRTKEGSNYVGNVNVSENMSYQTSFLRTYSLSTTRVEPEDYDGMTREDWLDSLDDEEEEE